MRDIVDELDLALAHALQLRPRAPWALLGRVLDVNPATVARRWERLQQAGLAWVSCTFDAYRLLYVEMECQPGTLETTCQHLLAQSHVVYVHHLSGPRSLLIAVAISDLAAASAYLRQDLDTLPGVRACYPEMLVTAYGGGGSWRLRTLDSEQQRALRTDDATTVRLRSLDNIDRELVRALAEDARAPYPALAARTGISEPTARRRVSHLIGAGWVRLRCELAQSLSGWPVGTMLWGRVPPHRLEPVARSLATMPEIRMCAGMTGARNLLLTAWLHDLTDLPKLEATITDRFPDIIVTDRAGFLRNLKHFGRLLDADGRSAGFMPITTWRPGSTVDNGLS